MKFPRYWARAFHETKDPSGATVKCSSVRWSEVSVADAYAEATRFAPKLAQAILAGDPPVSYPYGDRPLCEERIREIEFESGTPAALITRNAYGALVLNTARVMFIDFDFPPSRSLFASPKKLFGIEPKIEAEIVTRVTEWALKQPQWGMRLYRTANGLRALVTHATFDPTSKLTRDLLTSADCDPLYIKLCEVQECFRARLTPKFWRCKGVSPPPSRFPWASPKDESTYRDWEKKYESVSKEYSVCRFISEVGASAMSSEAALIVREHDKIACARSDKPLA